MSTAAPKLSNIDHVHINVGNWADAEAWYHDVLGFRRVEALMAWAVEGGPLTIEDTEGSVHLALFESSNPVSTDAVAFGTNSSGFLEWKNKLEGKGLELRLTDHTLAYSLYFSDPWANLFEITTYERDAVAQQLVE